MRFASIKSLQRDYGLPFVTAATIIHEQNALARQHYRRWYMLAGTVVAISLACKFAPRDSLYYRMDDFVFPLACLGVGLAEALIQRKAQPSIIAAARAASTTAATAS
jgi:hypothetical protein